MRPDATRYLAKAQGSIAFWANSELLPCKSAGWSASSATIHPIKDIHPALLRGTFRPHLLQLGYIALLRGRSDLEEKNMGKV